MRLDDLSMSEAAQGAEQQDLLELPENAVRVAPGPGGSVTLPAGTEVEDIQVVGRDLVVELPDGSYMIILGGAVFVPQLIIGDIEVLPTTLAALLIGEEPEPAAGDEQSSGGNFAIVVPDLGPPVPLGDLLPPTALFYTPPEFRDIGLLLNRIPDIVIDTPEEPFPVPDANAIVDEGGLPARGDEPEGTHSQDDSEQTTGEFIFSSPDNSNGVVEAGGLTVNGVVITEVGQQIQGTYGILTITGISDGVVTYSYTLTDNTVNGDVSDVFIVTVTDPDGDMDTATLTIGIIDDVPIARDDVVTLGNGEAADGNALTGEGSDAGAASGDTFGADDYGSWGVFDDGELQLYSGTDIVIDGDYGTLTIGARGEWSYERFDDSPLSATDTFDYVLRDGDGSQSQAQIIINIDDLGPSLDIPVLGEAGTQVDEAGLPARTTDEGDEPAGTEAPTDGEITEGTITFGAGDGATTILIDGQVAVPGLVVTNDEGTLEVLSIEGGQLTYRFTLADNTSGENTSTSFTVTVRDADGDSVTGSLVIDILDDAPEAATDTVSIVGETTVSGNVVTGEGADNPAAADDVVGADGFGDWGVVVDGTVQYAGDGSVVIDGDYGTLTISAGGEWTYTRDNDAPLTATETFDYVLVDGDGSQSTAQLIINIDDAGPSLDVPVLGEAGTQVDEAGLPARSGDKGAEPAGSEAPTDGEITEGTISFGAGDGATTITINGMVAVVGLIVTNDEGTLEVLSIEGGQLQYRFTLADNTSGDATSTSFDIAVSDADGDTESATLVIDIVDDEPTARDDTNSIDEGEFGPVTGNVVTENDTVGADDALVVAVASDGNGNSAVVNADGSVTITGEYGELTIAADGSYSYERFEGTPGGVEDVFTYTLEDGDGDQSQAQLTISIADAGVTLDIPVAGGAGTLVDEDGLPARGDEAEGSEEPTNSEFTSGSIGFDAADGLGSITVNGVTLDLDAFLNDPAFEQIVADNDQGLLVITGVTYDPETGLGSIDYEYTLRDNTSGDDTSVSFPVVVSDSDAAPDTDSAAGNLVINIVDDVPDAVDDVVGSDDIVENADVTVDVIANDTEGADSVDLVNDVEAVDGSLTGAGELTYNGDGTFTYSPAPGEEGIVTFQYRITDGDNDSDVALVTIDLGTDTIPTIGPVDAISADEDSLAGSNDDEGNVDPDEIVYNADPTGQVVVSFGADMPMGEAAQLNAFAFSDSNIAALNGLGLTSDGDPITFALSDDGRTLTGSDADGAVIVIRITGAVEGPNAGDVTYSYEVELLDNVDQADPSGEDSLGFDVAFDVTDSDGDQADGSIGVTVYDDVQSGGAPSVSQDGENAPVIVTIGAIEEGADGVDLSDVTYDMIPGLSYDGAGTFTYTPQAGQEGVVNFSYTIVDGDGDTLTQDVSFTLTDTTPGNPLATDAVVDEDGLAGANDDEGQVDPTEVDGTDSDTATGTITIDFGADAPSDPVANFQFINVAALNGQFTQAGEPVVFSVDANGDLVGQVDGETVITIAITGATTDANGVVTYSYSVDLDGPLDQADPTIEDALAFDVQFRASEDAEANGTDSVTGSFTVTVRDDVPSAQDDSDTVAQGTYGPITGDVTDNDTVGADESPLTSTAMDADGEIVAVSSDGNANGDVRVLGDAGDTQLQVQGEFGVLTINADGTYSYVRDAGTPGGVDDVFTYTFSDADGDEVTAQLTISIGDADPFLDVPDAGAPGTEVDEAGLPPRGETPGTGEASDGNPTNASDQSEVSSEGTISFGGGDAPLTVTINGVLIPETGPYPTIAGNNGYGSITITGVDYDTGTITYVYTLADNTSGDDTVDTFDVVVNDVDGPPVSATFEVEIVDDAPITQDDFDVIQENDISVSGNVITESYVADSDGDGYVEGDLVGADGAVVVGIVTGDDAATDTDQDPAGYPIVIDGEYGTIAIAADGSYTYTLDNSDPEVSNLAADESLTEQFVYTLEDGDGDYESAVLTITINGQNAAPTVVGAVLNVSEEGFDRPGEAEDGIPDGDGNDDLVDGPVNVGGADADGDAVTYTLEEPTGTYYTADGTLITWSGGGTGTIVGSAGGQPVLTVSIDASGNVTAQLSQPIYHGTQDTGDGNIASTESIDFEVIVTDEFGATNQTDAFVTVNIEDDVPLVTVKNGTVVGELTVDETDLSQDATANYSDRFSVLFGGDGADGDTLAGGTSYDLELVLTNGNNDSGLVDTATGMAVLLKQVGNQIIGYIDDSADDNDTVVFTLTSDGSGSVTLDQQRAVVNPLNPNQDEPVFLDDGADAPVINLTVTATDEDNDTDSASLDITGDLRFEDDGPSLTVTNVDTNTGDQFAATDDDGDPSTGTIDLDDLFTVTDIDAGADGQKSLILDYSLGFAAGYTEGDPTTLSSGGETIYLYQDANGVIIGSTSATEVGAGDASVVFTLTLDDVSGEVTLEQFGPIDHGGDGDVVPFPSGYVEATFSATLTDRDDDAVTQTETADLGGNFAFNDDEPMIETGDAVVPDIVLDETRPEGSDEEPGVDSLSTGDMSKTVDLSVDAGYFDLDPSADTPNTVTYTLGLGSGAQGVASGIYALDASDTETVIDPLGQGAEILLYEIGGVIYGSTAASEGTVTTGNLSSGNVYFTIAVNGDGEVTFTQTQNVWHGATGDDDDLVEIDLASGTIELEATVTDFDGDTSSAYLDLSEGVFGIEDDGPSFGLVDNTLTVPNSGDVSNTGDFQFDVGTDGARGGTNAILDVTLAATVNGDPVQNVQIQEVSEDATTAVYSFSFDYADGPNSTATANGTLTFDKDAGTYTVDLDEPISGFSVANTAGASSFTGYEEGTTNVDNSQPEVSVTQINSQLFVQFTGEYEPGSGTGANNLKTSIGGDLVFTGTTTSDYSALEQIFNTDQWVSVSNQANGVGGDTIGGGEVLNFSLYDSNPAGITGTEPTASAEELYLKFDGIGAQEEFIVILNLYDPNTGLYTQRALIVENGDILKGPGSGTGFASGVTLDNNDGLIVIEANDYKTAGEDWVIVGAQVVATSEGISGTGYNFDNATGENGGSLDDTQSFSVIDNSQPLKISDIGFLTTLTTDQSAELTFDVTIGDADGDTETTTLEVTVGGDASATAATAQVTQQASITGLNADNDNLMLSQETTNSLMMGSAIGVAFGLAMMSGPAQGNAYAHLDGSMDQFSVNLTNTIVEFDAMLPTAANAIDADWGGFEPQLSVQLQAMAETTEWNGGSIEGDAGQSAPAQPMVVEQAPVEVQAPDLGATFGGGDVVMPGGDALAALGALNAGQPDLGAILGDALVDLGGADVIETALASLGEGGGGMAMIEPITPDAAIVSLWDGLDMGGFTTDYAANMGPEAIMLQPDAAAIVANG